MTSDLEAMLHAFEMRWDFLLYIAGPGLDGFHATSCASLSIFRILCFCSGGISIASALGSTYLCGFFSSRSARPLLLLLVVMNIDLNEVVLVRLNQQNPGLDPKLL